VRRLKREFFVRSNVVRISKDLLGKFLLTRFNGGKITGGMIVETEAYAGTTDRASHAYGGRRTRRTEVMYARGGVAYVYLCYGIHALFNIITNREDVPHAILIRAIEPVDGIETMLRRRDITGLEHRLTSGPGALSAALGIGCEHSGCSLLGPSIWIEDRGLTIRDSNVLAGLRVGIAYAGPDARRPWRFRVKDSIWTSKAK
jgi:DNA-3-methyladenine glycosylase